MCSKNFSILYEEPTTYKHDYLPPLNRQIKKVKPVIIKNEKPSSRSSSERALRMTAYDTFQRLDSKTKLPFDALWVPKEIVKTDLGKALFCKTPGIGQPKEIKSKTCISPAIDLDKIKDPVTHKIIVDFTYTTTKSDAANETWNNFQPHKFDLLKIAGENPAGTVAQSLEASTNKAQHFLEQAYLDEESNNPLKSNCIQANERSDFLETRCKIRDLIEKNQLRLSYRKTPLSYTGYKSNVARGIPMQKRYFPVVHPDVTSAQAMSKRHADDLQL